MTKRDGDILRAMVNMLNKMAEDYPATKEAESMMALRDGLKLLLNGHNVIVRIKK